MSNLLQDGVFFCSPMMEIDMHGYTREEDSRVSFDDIKIKTYY